MLQRVETCSWPRSIFEKVAWTQFGPSSKLAVVRRRATYQSSPLERREQPPRLILRRRLMRLPAGVRAKGSLERCGEGDGGVAMLPAPALQRAPHLQGQQRIIRDATIASMEQKTPEQGHRSRQHIAAARARAGDSRARQEADINRRRLQQLESSKEERSIRAERAQTRYTQPGRRQSSTDQKNARARMSMKAGNGRRQQSSTEQCE